MQYFHFLMILLIGMLCSQAHAERVIQLNSNESKSITNSSLWTVNATCTIQGEPADNKIKIRVLKNRGTINGRSLSSGQATTMKLRANRSISVSAESGAQINLVNLSDEPIEAVCNT